MMKDHFTLLFTFSVLCFCFVTMGQFIPFLSFHRDLNQNIDRNVSLINKRIEKVWWLVIIDVGLLIIFFCQHSIQAKKWVKDFLTRKGYDAIQRLLYNAGTCLALQLLIKYWNPIPNIFLWRISTSQNALYWWLFTAIHWMAWIIIYSECLIMDMAELLGFKQVYYHMQGRPDPMCQKSQGLCRFYSHMRHPGFTALNVILFAHPVMNLDRFILACALTTYMICAFKVDAEDCKYNRRQLQRKKHGLRLTD